MKRWLRKHRSKKMRIAIIVIGLILATLGTVTFTVGWEVRQEAIKTLNGNLIPFPLNTTNPFKIIFTQDIYAPGNSHVFSYDELSRGIDLNDVLRWFLELTTNQFKIQFNDNQIYVSADIKDSNGNEIAQIVNNLMGTC